MLSSNTNATQTLSPAVGEVAEGGQCGAHVLRGQPESLGDEEQHREVQEDEGGDRGRLSGPRTAQGDALGERKVLLRPIRVPLHIPRHDSAIHDHPRATFLPVSKRKFPSVILVYKTNQLGFTNSLVYHILGQTPKSQVQSLANLEPGSIETCVQCA